MFSHVFVSVSDFERAHAFYATVMQVMGLEQRFCDPDKPWAAWHSQGATRPYFVIGKPFDGQAHQPGNGQMFAFTAKNRAMVRAAYATALAAGAHCAGAPMVRPHYHENYYGAYFRDLDGNKLCVVCHAPESEN